MYLLDTNVISELRKSRANENLVQWASKKPAEQFFISAITVLEIELGILQLERKDQSQAKVLRTWLNTHVLTSFSNRIFPFDTEAALRCANLHIPDPRSERDAMIAAIALANNKILVTRNTRDFENCGAKIINPWQ